MRTCLFLSAHAGRGWDPPNNAGTRLGVGPAFSGIYNYHCLMTESTSVKSFKTEELDADTRNAIVNVCVIAHQEEDFKNLFSYVPSGGWHFLAFQGEQLVSHAMVTTRWLQPEGQPL